MKLVVLGSGTSVPHPHRASAGFWLETESGTLLLDISADAPHRMAQEQLDWPNLEAIWISHFHLDHLGGLAPFLFGTRWAPQIQDRRKSLRIYGPKGLGGLVSRLNDVNDYKLLEQVFPVEVIEVEPGEEFQILPGVKAATLATPHTSESLAIRLIDQAGKRFVYTSDTGYTEKLIEFAKGANLILLECSFIRNKPFQSHLELDEAMQLIRECRPGTAMLAHLYPEWDAIDVGDSARTLWSEAVLEAVDGLHFEF